MLDLQGTVNSLEIIVESMFSTLLDTLFAIDRSGFEPEKNIVKTQRPDSKI